MKTHLLNARWKVSVEQLILSRFEVSLPCT